MLALQGKSEHRQRIGSCSGKFHQIFHLDFITISSLNQAREALKKYLHYYERWENHSKSLQLEQQTLDRLKTRINEKVMKGLSSSTWIDYQYLFVAATLLARCRYTLQYTYPYAYYLEPSSRKDLFEYQQVSKDDSLSFRTTQNSHFSNT